MSATVRALRPSPSSIEAARQAVARVKLEQAEIEANHLLFVEIEEQIPYLESLARSLGEAAFRRNRIETQHQMNQIAHVVRALIPLVNTLKSAS